ncbi:hypothetical protein WISP_31687 [Willisornis vidua]|uniref:Uncharacterized protein n=1 Tax=Willisornis vidua TaxID=1566151 RepID=A0ABQ9DJY5_9PASS|nr:hypothetical protein WISP_31687 [Willisornis vidua]
MHIPEYSQIVSPLYLVTCKKNEFQQAFKQIRQEIAHAVTLGPLRTGPDVKNAFYSALETMILPGASHKQCLVRPGANHLHSGVEATEDLKPATTPTEKELLSSL